MLAFALFLLHLSLVFKHKLGSKFVDVARLRQSILAYTSKELLVSVDNASSLQYLYYNKLKYTLLSSLLFLLLDFSLFKLSSMLFSELVFIFLVERLALFILGLVFVHNNYISKTNQVLIL